ncbi:linear amide C-N hydrolase [Verrucomicrobiota bacterium]
MMNKSKTYLWLTIVLMLTLLSLDAAACLTFCLQNGKNIVYGRNFDWNVDVGAVIVNRRHVRKTAFVLSPEKPVSWVSKYGSVTFNQFSKEVPVGGMNEQGLVIESLVSETKHPCSDERKTINELQWIQYHLDTCRTVDEVIQSARCVRISPYAVKLHYFISDHSGRSAVIEFIQGKMVHRSAEGLPVKVLANTSYDRALKTVMSQRSRFARAARMIRKYDGRKNAVEYAFGTLDAVAQGDFTKWQVVYDIPHRRIYFRTLRKRKIKLITLSDFDFEHEKKALMLDININGEGSMQGQFKIYTEELNDYLMKASLREFKKAGMMQHIKSAHIEHIRKVVALCKHEPRRTPTR